MSASVREISISSEPGRAFFLKVDWTEDLGEGFSVTLCDAVSAWNGKVSQGDVQREAEEMEMEREKYIHDLQLALTAEGRQAAGYAFHLSPDSTCSGVLHLSYEKVQRDISFSLGSVELRPVLEPTVVIKDLISYGLQRGARLQASNDQLQGQNQRLREEHDHIKAEMDRYVHGKENLEQELYSRFVVVLNEKKAKIRGLLENIRQLQDELDEKEKSLREGSAGTRIPPRESEEQGETSTPAKDEYEGSTDEEQSQSPPRFQAAKSPARELPAHSSIDDSLTESLTDIIDIAPCRKRRQRHLQGPEVKKATQEVQRKESTEPAKSKEEGRRKASRRSAPIPMDNVEPDDLFDDF
ncbi:hypothetical protein AGOR_G00015350 [Albula goreensis]|uniref:DNA repair protein XRCC4 n=1 Tax=Albula goreensis TaxID=1534307 RepID=A0A8T3E8F9_9TELE|nr:hypothetical protein AGOR_G00015350 [Albula goreensis]